MPLSEIRPDLRPSDYIFSPSGLFFGILEPNGRFVVYRGGGPQEKGDELWSPSTSTLPSGWELQSLTIWGGPRKGGVWEDPSYLRIVTREQRGNRWGSVWKSTEWNVREYSRGILTDDGNFCIYGTEQVDKLFWQSGVTDPVERYDIAKLEYDTASAKFISSGAFTLDSLDVDNPSDEKQTSSISRTLTTGTTRSWTHQVGSKLVVKTTFKTGIPIVAEGKVEVSAEFSYAYTWGQTETDTQTFTVTAPVTVGPHQRGHVLISATRSTIQVPYTLSGDVIYKSGKRIAKRLSGIFEGLNSHSVKVKISTEPIGAPATAAAARHTEDVPAQVKVSWGSQPARH